MNTTRMNGLTGNAHVSGVPWWEAPLPWRLHRCQPQTSGFLSTSFDLIERCACGAHRRNAGRWYDRNSRNR